MLTYLVSGTFLLMSNFVFLFAFTFFFFLQFARGFRNTVVSDYINQMTSSDMRATVLSLESFIGRLIYAAIIPLFGWVADVYTLKQAFTLMGVSCLVLGTIIILILTKGKVLDVIAE